MARILLLHHVLGATPGLSRFKERLEALGLEVVMPDLFMTNTFDNVDDGLEYAESHWNEVLDAADGVVSSNVPFDAIIGVSFGALIASRLSRYLDIHSCNLIYISAFVPPEVSSMVPTRPKVTVIASGDDPYFDGEDQISLATYSEEFTETVKHIFVGRSHFFIDDSHAEYSDALFEITIEKICQSLEGQGIAIEGRGRSDLDSKRALVEFLETDFDDPRLIYCTQRYRQELYLQIGIDPVTDEELKEFNSKGVGRFFVALFGGDAVGTVTLAALKNDDFEVKRLWVSPLARGMGVGRGLMDRLESVAREMGCKRLLLDTHADLTEAVGLYRALGYREGSAYNENQRAQIWMSKVIE
ncbi:MAG: GNAT family N-acetyltransferase [Actinomycetota bacterium]|nr:GNAT family N-acetyltransferase [Actinomycetota bacterium]